ncbi:flavin monoamine oxidase family protein [Nocardia sp. NPDC127526]|uniref:flavin monoamine oxidase family protein n=1 Tax=Nocardia sp. NPDC127526 TaxID=3345393 RepID=UPI0036325042
MEQTTVAIVGAGFAGLTTARALRARGIDVLVLESADRAGGRALTEVSAAGTPVDLGGQWIGRDHTRMSALAGEFGMTLFPTHTAGRTLMVDGTRGLETMPGTIAAAGVALLGLELMARTGRGSDRTTVADWVSRVPGRRARRLLDVVLSEALAIDLDQVSVRALTTGIESAGGLRAMLGTAGGAQDSLLSGGAGGLARALAAELGARVHLNRRATAIMRTADRVIVDTPAGPVRADRVVVTAPPPVAAGIRHDPPLPPERAAAERNTVMGVMYKAIAVYDAPFWRERGLSGEIVSLDGPVPAAFDISPPGGPGHVGLLVPGRAARTLDELTPTARRDTVLRALSRHLGDRIMNPLSWHEKSWHLDPHVGGGYSALPKPGHLSALTRAGAATGRVHWAGTETAPRWTGYFEGAVRSGERAAAEVMAALGFSALTAKA